MYWLGVCHAWFHLHLLPLAARSGSEIYQFEKKCFKADMNSDILLQTEAIFFFIEALSETVCWLGVFYA